jgi:hypothetical protein
VLQWRHESLAAHAHNPPHSSRSLECGRLTPPTHYYLESSGQAAYMETHRYCTLEALHGLTVPIKKENLG